MEAFMLIAFDDKVTRDYTITSDTEPKTIFKLGTFDTFMRAKVEAGLSKVQDNPDDMTFWLIQIVKFGLKGWDNLNVPFTSEEMQIPGVGKRIVASDAAILSLKLEWINELATEIIKDNLLQGKELKN